MPAIPAQLAKRLNTHAVHCDQNGQSLLAPARQIGDEVCIYRAEPFLLDEIGHKLASTLLPHC